MRILFITSSSINGGAQKHIRDMFRCLTEDGNEVYLAAPSGWLMLELEAYSERLTILDTIKDINILSRLMATIKPDITNTFILSGGFFGTIAWRRKKYGKLFITVNNPVIYDGISMHGRILYPRLYRWMSRYASAFLVKSDAVRDEVATVLRKKKKVLSIKNGIDFSLFDHMIKYPDLRAGLGISASDIVISNVAVLEERKGQQYIIDAVKELRISGVPIHLMLSGGGTDEARLKQYVKSINADEYVHFLGYRSDINVILANSNIFVLSSLHEGLPNALMEAMSMAIPCVATDIGGVRQLITTPNEGVVILPKSADEIRNAIISIISSPDIGRSMGESAYIRMLNEYSLKTAVEQLMEIYQGRGLDNGA